MECTGNTQTMFGRLSLSLKNARTLSSNSTTQKDAGFIAFRFNLLSPLRRRYINKFGALIKNTVSGSRHLLLQESSSTFFIQLVTLILRLVLDSQKSCLSTQIIDQVS